MGEKIEKIVAAAYDRKAALDLSAAFLRSGLSVELFTSMKYRNSKAQAVVFNTESFGLSAEKEYALVHSIFSGAPKDAACFFKTDSSLRGNVGAELAALRAASGVDTLFFMPAFLKARKFTRCGCQYQNMDDAKEQFLADVPALLANFNPRISIVKGCGDEIQSGGICILDCTSEREFMERVEWLKKSHPKSLAGTSSLAQMLGNIYALTPAGACPISSVVPLRVDGHDGALDLETLEWKERGCFV